MKLFAFVLSLFFVTQIAFATASNDIVAKVLQDAQVTRLTKGARIVSVEQTAQYRCIGCYEFTITQQTPIGVQQIIVKTQAVGSELNVEVVSVTR